MKLVSDDKEDAQRVDSQRRNPSKRVFAIQESQREQRTLGRSELAALGKETEGLSPRAAAYFLFQDPR